MRVRASENTSPKERDTAAHVPMSNAAKGDVRVAVACDASGTIHQDARTDSADSRTAPPLQSECLVTGHKIVDAITRLRITGTLVPWSWLPAIKTPSGLPDLLACFILSDIVWWHRAREVHDPRSGTLLGYQKKFRTDAFQRSIQSWCHMTGATSKQVRSSIARLKLLGLIKTQLRKPRINNEASTGYPTLYYIPSPKAISALTWPVDNPGKTGVLKDSRLQTGVLQGTNGVLQGTNGVLQDDIQRVPQRVHKEYSGRESSSSSPKPNAETVKAGIVDFLRGGSTVEFVVRALEGRYTNVQKVVLNCEKELQANGVH